MALPLARLVQRRRLLFLWFNVILFALAVAPMIELLGSHGWSFLRCLLLLVFLPLMAQVVFGFTLAATCFAGLCQLCAVFGDHARVREGGSKNESKNPHETILISAADGVI